MNAAGTCTQQFWEAAEPVYRQIICHPFVIGLCDGTLPHAVFARYLAQDVLYIHDDNLALETLSTRAPREQEAAFFRELARDGLEIERALHDEFLQHFQVPAATQKTDTCAAYTAFLQQHAAHEPYEVAVAALLPCFWFYGSVGEYIVQHAAPDNEYQAWIDTYSGGDYAQYTTRFIAIAEQCARQATPEVRMAMEISFVTGCKHELAFFSQ